MTTARERVALAHDYLTQRGGAERVVAVLARAFPAAPLYTTLYDPAGTFDDFAGMDVRASVANRVPLLRRHHRLAFPALAPLVSGMQVDADVLLTSSSGWAHGIRCTGRKVVYCHAPARWLYQRERYLGPAGGRPGQRARRQVAGLAVAALGGPLRSWDRRRAAEADRYLVNSTVVARAVEQTYGISAEVVPPPPALRPGGPLEAVPGLVRPFVLCVARLLPYKNVGPVIEAVRSLDGVDLVVVGRGPDEERLRGIAVDDPRVHLLGAVDDAALRWLYDRCEALVAASYEDYGLSPLEAAAFGRPTAALHAGGFLDTIDPEVNGVFFEQPEAREIAVAVEAALGRGWDADAVRAHAERFGEERFAARLRAVVDDALR